MASFRYGRPTGILCFLMSFFLYCEVVCLSSVTLGVHTFMNFAAGLLQGETSGVIGTAEQATEVLPPIFGALVARENMEALASILETSMITGAAIPVPTVALQVKRGSEEASGHLQLLT